MCIRLFTFLISVQNKTNRFHVAVGLFSNRSQKTSKYGKSVTSLFLPHFDIICDLSLNRHMAIWNLFLMLIQASAHDPSKIHCILAYYTSGGKNMMP